MVSRLKPILSHLVFILLAALLVYLVVVPIILLIWGGFKPGGLLTSLDSRWATTTNFILPAGPIGSC